MAVGAGMTDRLLPVAGVELATVSAGIKKPGRKDVVLIRLSEGSSVAGVFTLNAFCAAPVQLCKKHLAATAPRYLLTNTGNANAGTGRDGMARAVHTCEALAAAANCEVNEILPFSTGVIGEPLPADKIVAVLPEAIGSLHANGWEAAASGIMTTDTRPKGASVQLALGGKTVTITGITKGAGMIKPNMATMLGYVATDLAVEQEALRQLLSDAVNLSFNRITIDGDTSTNDSTVLMATGCAGVQFGDLSVAEQAEFAAALNALMADLAKQIVRDGEGATKFVTVNVVGGKTAGECLKVGYTIAESPLVKTALFASDPNWGRILACVGRAGVDNLVLDDIVIHLGDALIVEQGGRAASYTEAAGKAAMAQAEIIITVDLRRGSASETVYTCDFSHDYVTINAEYRT